MEDNTIPVSAATDAPKAATVYPIDPKVQARSKDANKKADRVAEVKLGLKGSDKGAVIGTLVKLAYQVPSITQKELAAVYGQVGIDGIDKIAKALKKVPETTVAARQRAYEKAKTGVATPVVPQPGLDL